MSNYNRKEFIINDHNYLLNYNWPGNVRELKKFNRKNSNIRHKQ